MVKTEVVVVEVKRFYAVHNTYTRVFTHIHIHRGVCSAIYIIVMVRDDQVGGGGGGSRVY